MSLHKHPNSPSWHRAGLPAFVVPCPFEHPWPCDLLWSVKCHFWAEALRASVRLTASSATANCSILALGQEDLESAPAALQRGVCMRSDVFLDIL